MKHASKNSLITLSCTCCHVVICDLVSTSEKQIFKYHCFKQLNEYIKRSLYKDTHTIYNNIHLLLVDKQHIKTLMHKYTLCVR